jgi:signal transduction histidine kinase
MIRRLSVRLYLATLVSLGVVVLLSALLWSFTAERTMDAVHDRFVATLVTAALADNDPQFQQAVLARLAVPPVESLQLLDRNGRQLAQAGRPPSPATGPGLHADDAVQRIRLTDGRVAVLRMHSQSLHLHLGGLALLALIALAVAVATYPVMRHLTSRLEALAVSVDRFGHGELAARAPVAGDDEVSSLASTFNSMADRVETLLAAHGRLLMNASHELRSPLTRVRLALELYEVAPRPELMQGMRRDCAEIEDQIEEILLASKLETIAKPLPDEWVDLEVLVAEESARLGVPFDTVPANVQGDVRLLRRLIRNLLENARKHGGNDVEARVWIDGDDTRVLQVSDRGPGIPAEERERIFEPFYRPANASETGDGWGLGLSLVRQIADRHHGSVRCLSRPGGGCVFEVRLPGVPAVD